MPETLTPPARAPSSGARGTPPAAPRRTRRRALWLLPGLGLLVVIAPVVLLAGAGNPPTECGTSAAAGPGGITSTGTPAAGQFTAPLTMQPGKTYSFGATTYGGPEDPTSGSVGSSGTYLPGRPDSFAELSVLDSNPANNGAFTFQDANALGELPYGSNVRVRAANGRSLVLAKEDTGYGQGPSGQGPGSTVYRMDVWYQAAAQLGISKTPITAQLAPSSGAGATLGQLPVSNGGPAASPPSAGCGSGPAGPLPLTPGQTAQINPNTGIASAPESAPQAVKLAIAAANQLIAKPYVWGGGHENLGVLATGYDCSGSSEYVLHQASLYAPTSGPPSADMEDVFPGGAGKWITVYANGAHMWLVVAGIVLDTAWYAPIEPTNPGSGPRWQPGSVVAAQIAGNAHAGYPPFVVTHPQGL
jgi:hypothetical protein